MIQRWASAIQFLILLFSATVCASAASFDLNDGSKLTGEAISANAQGLVVKKEDGSFAPRVPWTNFTQNALKQLAQDPKAKLFVDPLLEAADDEAAMSRKAAAEINVKIPPRLERPDRGGGVGALFRSPLSILLVLAAYLANIYAAFEISIFRNYPAAAVCAAAAVFPILGPALFLCLPTRLKGAKAETTETLAEEHQVEHVVTETGVPGDAEDSPPPAPAEPAVPDLPAPVVYQRGHFSFNRRFFETKMPGFMRMVPSEAEKDMVIVVKSSRGEYRASRIAKLTPNELFLHVPKGNASTEVMIPYAELAEVQIRHKDLH